VPKISKISQKAPKISKISQKAPKISQKYLKKLEKCQKYRLLVNKVAIETQSQLKSRQY